MVGATRSSRQTRVTDIDEDIVDNYPPSPATVRSSQEAEALTIRTGQTQHNVIANTNKVSEGQHEDQETTNEAVPLGEHVKEAMGAISLLEGLGLQRQNIPLPKIVVLGEQSTGKSSVIEALSGIKTPRDTDTCTRCPIFISLGPANSPWTARVTLRRHYSFDGNFSRRRKFPGWEENQSAREIAFSTTTSKDGLEAIIRAAQQAMLTPMAEDHELAQFLNTSTSRASSYHRAEFSPNVVCIYITGPDLPTLSLYDLPGIIGQSETPEAQYLVQFVRTLVKDYIKDPDSLILLTCSLENDLANSNAAAMARELKATDRCIGVLTKPDRLPVGTRPDKLREVLDGCRYSLGHGYFVVKNLDQEAIDRQHTHHEARLQEQAFFRNAPWTTDFQANQSRFGALKLQTFLSKRLAANISKKLPTIHQQINSRLQEVNSSLAQIPEPPRVNAVRMIAHDIFQFSEDIRKEMEAEHPFRNWKNSWKTLEIMFLAGLEDMKPRMFTSGELDKDILASSMKASDDIIIIDSEDDDDVAPTPLETPSKKRKAEKVQTPAGTPSKRPTRSPMPPSTEAHGSVDGNYRHLRKVFNLDEVSRHLHERSNSRIPGQIEPKVIYDMMLKTLHYWDLPMQRFFADLNAEVESLVGGIFLRHFGKWRESKLFHSAGNIAKNVVQLNMTTQRDTMAAESLGDERNGPFIYHEKIFQNEIQVVLQAYAKARYSVRQKIFFNELLANNGGRELSNAEIERRKKDPTIQALICKEPYKTEVEIVAQVTTYYMYAARRFHDTVCMRLESKFFKQLGPKIRSDLESGLGIYDEANGSQNAVDLLAEPRHRQDERKELLTMRDALLQGQQHLVDLQKKYDADTTGNGRSSSFGSFTPQSDEMV